MHSLCNEVKFIAKKVFFFLKKVAPREEEFQLTNRYLLPPPLQINQILFAKMNMLFSQHSPTAYTLHLKKNLNRVYVARILNEQTKHKASAVIIRRAISSPQ